MSRSSSPSSSSAPTMVSLTIAKPVFRTLILGTSVLGAKMLVTNLYSWVPKVFAGFGPPEDSILVKWLGIGTDRLSHRGPSKEQPAHHDAQAQDAYLRAQRVIMNDLENIPISIMCFWAAALANPKAGKSVSRAFGVFVVARCAHTALYLGGVTGIRNVAFMAGFAATARAIALAMVGGRSCH
jgi:uncharacterized MAPEG superfamily protein